MKKIKVVLWLLVFSAQAVAQVAREHSACVEDSISPVKEAILSEVTVSGLTGTQRMKDSPIPFAVITPKKYHQSFGTNIVDAIKLQPGVSQISTGASISKPVIRGLGYNRVVVVEQGIRQEGQQWGDEHGLEVDAEGVHSVEILKGPASLMYGSDAIAGVMILHPEPMLEEGTMQAKVGGEYQTNNGLYNYHVGFAGNENGWLWNVHYTGKHAHCYKNQTDDYVPGTWFRERDFQAMAGVQKHWGHSFLRFSHVNFVPGIAEGERDENTGELIWEDGNSPKKYGLQMPFQRVLHTKVVSDNSWYIGMGTLKAIVGYQQNYRREFEESMDEAELAMRLHTVNYDVRYQLPLANEWNFATGINGMWQKNVNQAEEMLIPDYHLFDFGYFLTADKEIGRWHLSGGARIDNRSLSTKTAEEEGELLFSAFKKNFIGVTGSLGAVYNVNDRMNLRLNASRGFRAPTVSELSSNGVHEGSIQYELGNSELKPEYSTQIDLGMDYTSHFASLNAALFANWISNYIFLGRLPYETEGYRTYQYRQGDACLIGGEISVDVHPINALHIENAFSYVRGIQLHQPSESRNLPLMPAPRWTCDVRYEFQDFARGHCRRTFICAGMEYNLRQDKFYAFDNTETATPDYAVFNLSAGMDLHIFGHNCIEFTLCAQNLFDKVYQSHLSRLKYADTNCATGRQGISAIGRNVCLRLNIPINL
ncbi:MAG: TonB-dependent receptor [Prevotellaceae bacterium]|nr:TonB-dependent receptor [Prevotellaceae bacterium]